MTENPGPPDSQQFVRAVPEGDDRERLVCAQCGVVHYENPKIVVGVVPYTGDGRVLLCRRNIPPRKSTWTMPAGYMELGETAEHGAKREAWEEAGADVVLENLIGTYSIPHIAQVQLIYRGRLINPETVEAGPESETVELVPWAAVPWDELSFPSVRWALTHFAETYADPVIQPRENPDRPDPETA